ncbi:MAG: hypothetical protein GY940_32670 [bacterium]|nr:hypothetical protein [bacterium]
MKRKITVAIVFIFFFISCTSKPDGGLDAGGVTLNNRGAGLMGQFKYEEARKVFSQLAKKYPDNLDIRINHAISIFNRQQEGDEKAALVILEAVLEREPANLRALYCSGLLRLHSGNAEKALVFFQSVIKSDPRDIEAIYFAGKALMQLSRYEEALTYFNRAIAGNQYMSSALYGKIMALRQLGKSDEAYAMIGEFQKLKNNPRARLVEFKYTKMGRKAEVLAIGQTGSPQAGKPEGPLFNPMKSISAKPQIPWRPFLKDRPPEPSSITICDINNDNHPDLFITRAVMINGGIGNALLIHNPVDHTYAPDLTHPLALVTKVNTALWGDLNDDGLVDVYLCRRGPNQLWQQDEGGKWRDVTNETQTANGNGDTVDGMVFDADHDGDLDIFLVNADGPNELYNNNRNGTFRPLASEYGLQGGGSSSRSVIIADLDADRDADIIVINQQPPHHVYINQLLWKYTPAEGFEAFVSSSVSAAVAGDINSDGRPELYSMDDQSNIHQWQSNDKGTWQSKTLEKGSAAGDPGGHSRLALADADGDGKIDLIASGKGGWWAASFTPSGLSPLFTLPDTKKESLNLASWTIINSTRGPILTGWSPGSPPLIWSAGSGRYAFASLKLSGLKDKDSTYRTNASGIGSRVAVRAGSRWTVFHTFRNNSGPGQGFQPVSAGLGDSPRIDYVAIDWSDGVFQTELNLEAGKIHRITETQRQLSSCPVIFAWNGKKYEFVSDFLGVGGIGYAIGPGEYSEPRPWENFMMPTGLLQPKNGRLIIKLTEPMEEAAYMDAIRLKAYDIPPGWSMTLDERMNIAGPVPTGEPRFYRNVILPEKAANDRQEDVTASISKNDLIAAPPGKLDRRFIGMLARDHVLTVTFSKDLDGFPGQAILVADGWLEYPYSQTSFAAWQAGAVYRAPTIEALRSDGKWVTILEQFGYPAGMPRRMSVPLPPLPKGVRTIRISTNQEIYWDYFAIAFVEKCPEAQAVELKLESAYLEQNGFPLRIEKPQHRPFYDYEKRQPFWDIHFLEGYYTRFGAVDELVRVKDNALAIFGSGEGIHLEYAEPTSPLKAGWTRVFVLETEGWCKDMDLYTDTSDTVGPVPSLGKRSGEAERLHRLYNTRYLSGKQ